MKHFDHPDIDVFEARDERNCDEIHISFGGRTGYITLERRSPNSLIVEQEQTIALPRHTLIGLAYSILAAVNQNP